MLASVQINGADVLIPVARDRGAWVGLLSTWASVTVALGAFIAATSCCSAVGGNGWESAVMP